MNGSRRRRRAGMVALWVLPSAILLQLTWCVYSTYRIDVPSRLGPEERAAIVERLRAAVEGRTQEAAGDLPALPDRPLDHDGPLIVAVWHEGRAVARVDAYGYTIARAVREAQALLAEQKGVQGLADDARREARIKVDVVVGRAALMRPGSRLSYLFEGFFGLDILPTLAVHAGIDGVGVTLNGRTHALLLPDELVRARLVSAKHPFKRIPELKVGLDLARLDKRLARWAGVPDGAFAHAEREYWRFRTDAFVEQPLDKRPAPPLALYRGLPPRPELTAANLRAAAIAGGRYLVAHLAANGRYIYEDDLTSGVGTDPEKAHPYSIPRHAGTTYFLAQLYRITHEAFLREPIERAFAHLKDLVLAGGCAGTTPEGATFECVVDRGQQVASLGSTALAVVALAEYRLATDDPRYDELSGRLAEWILFMQKDNGDFCHHYNIPRKERDEKTQLLYFTGEAALAMVLMHEITGDERYLRSAERALDYLVGWYDFFVGGFIYGQEHWTCIASEAAWPALKHDRYREFCDGYAKFLRMQQVTAGDFPDQPDVTGAYNVSPFVLPNNTPSGSQSEAMISAYLLGVHHGKPNPAIRAQVLRAMHYVLGQQIREESAWDVAPAAHGIGAIPGSPIDRKVRIDYVQHVCSAMIRTSELIETEGS